MIALRQEHLAPDTFLDVGDHAGEVATRDVALDHDAALDVLPHHEVRTAVFSKRGELAHLLDA